MKSLILCLVLLVMTASLAACNAEDTPAKGAQELLQALVELDGLKIDERTCAAQKEETQSEAALVTALGLLSEEFTGFSVLTDLKVDISDVAVSEIQRGENRALVRVTGKVRSAIGLIVETQEMDEAWTMVNEEGQWKYCGTAMTFTENGIAISEPVAMEFVRVPAGEFLMGSDPGDNMPEDIEMPQHSVQLDEFYIGKFEVTNEQYETFVRATGREAPQRWEGSAAPASRDAHPVVTVSWYDAFAYTEWLTGDTGMSFRLCSEAEWEKACRGTAGQIYPWGDAPPDPALANFHLIVGDTTPVGQYPDGTSPYGASDMSGNVWEWTSSLWGEDWDRPEFGYPYKPNDGRENLAAPDDVLRVLRGGSFRLYTLVVRCAVRTGGNLDSLSDDVGFRICMSPGF